MHALPQTLLLAVPLYFASASIGCGRVGFDAQDGGFVSSIPDGNPDSSTPDAEGNTPDAEGNKLLVGDACQVDDDCQTNYCDLSKLCAPPLVAVGRWPLDEGAGGIAYDQSDNANDGVLSLMDVSTSWVPRGTGTALHFDGVDDFVDCGADSSLVLSDSISIELWVRFDVLATAEFLVNNDLYTIFHRGFSDHNEIYFLFRIQEAADIGNSAWANKVGVRTTSTPVPNEWHHIVGTKEGNTLRIYFDGVKEKELFCESCFTVDDTVATALQLGSGFQGALDDVAIYSRAMTDDEVRQAYLDGL